MLYRSIIETLVGSGIEQSDQSIFRSH